MATTARRDLEATREVLRGWLRDRHGAADVEISPLTSPKAGYSNETLYLHLAWTPPDGPRRGEDLVLRIEPTGHQLFVTPDAVRQARIMQALAPHPGVPVPTIWYIEPDPTVLGSPFYLMGRVEGRVPGDVPSWHAEGWTVELSPAQRSVMHDNALASLVALHRIDVRDGFDFLTPAGTGTALDRYLAGLRDWHTWAQPSLRWEPETVAAAVDHLLRERPDDPAAGIVWGDARVGNISFGPEESVQAMFDWETATVGPPGIDLGWWLMFEDFLCEAQRLTRLEGVPDRAAIIARYQELSGRPVEHIDYYELLAATVMTLINSRLGVLLMTSGGLPERVASAYARRTIRMIRRGLDRVAA
ncbi:phosphotransferase family protein [Frankia sp. AiPs1]|uniref:phosphotransferase family protein n=1 Tax=Frankia sp. AiPs1 TaxID=573493 RepID=UPI002043B2AF|nr:phosphotransferase family protein [Frankia sp. AiPs1]MCM3922160.1 phosphotransferase family protein [Frankia sp. AiPs1]